MARPPDVTAIVTGHPVSRREDPRTRLANVEAICTSLEEARTVYLT